MTEFRKRIRWKITAEGLEQILKEPATTTVMAGYPTTTEAQMATEIREDQEGTTTDREAPKAHPTTSTTTIETDDSLTLCFSKHLTYSINHTILLLRWTNDLSLDTNIIMSEPATHSIDDYELLCVIGRGVFGKIYLVRELTTGDVFAMKVVKKHLIEQKNKLHYIFTERNLLIEVLPI